MGQAFTLFQPIYSDVCAYVMCGCVCVGVCRRACDCMLVALWSWCVFHYAGYSVKAFFL